MKIKKILPTLFFTIAALLGLWLVTSISQTTDSSFAEEDQKNQSETKAITNTVTTTEQAAQNTESEQKAVQSRKNTSRKNCLVDESALEDIKNRKEELLNKEKEIEIKTAEITAREKALAEELKKIEIIRDEIKQINATKIQKNEEKVAKLVETLESMSPKAAASIVANIEESLAVEAMARLSSLKLSKVLAAIEPKKSSQLAEALVGVARTRDLAQASRDALDATLQKGGDENANRKQSSNNSEYQRKQPEPAVGGG